MPRYINGKSPSSQEGQKEVVPKPEMLDFDFPEDALYSNHFGDNVSIASGSNIRSFFIGMGFSPSLIEKVIQENGSDVPITELADAMFTGHLSANHAKINISSFRHRVDT